MDSPFRSAQWNRVRQQILERDGYQCQIRGPKCTTKATEVDHIIPWRDGGSWYDPSNLRAACSWCNTWRANRQKNKEGWKRAKTRIILVIGPPAAGKTTYVHENASPEDLIVDYDAIASALGGQHKIVNKVRGQLLTDLRRGDVDVDRAWVISSNPRAEELFPHHEVVMMDPGHEAVLKRAAECRPVSFGPLIDNWYDRREAVEAGRREW